MTLKVSEIFYSLAGEGERAGEASIFIRLSGCSAKQVCFKVAGVNCDTEFESGKEMTLTQILMEAVLAIGRACPDMKPTLPGEPERSSYLWVVFSGGEPLDQLTEDHLNEFKSLGYKIAIETSGIRFLSERKAFLIDHITISPKVAEHVLLKNFGHLRLGDDSQPNVHELRYVRHAGQFGVPVPSLKAKYYYLSPHSDGGELNQANVDHCMKLCLENPQWRLSLQMHKVWSIL